MMKLIALSYSPWSEKARWALDHHLVDYDEESYEPLIGEILLRVRMRKPTGKVTVPVLQIGSRFITDSFDIARHAESIGRGTPLFPEGKLQEIIDWNRRSEEALNAARALMVLAAAHNPAAIRDAIPAAVPERLRPLMMPVARKGFDAFIRKYRMKDRPDAHQPALVEALRVLEATLSQGKRYILGEFSYADIAMAMVFQCIHPVGERYMPIGVGGRAAWTQPDIASRFAGLIEWRDELYARHRKTQARSAASHAGAR